MIRVLMVVACMLATTVARAEWKQGPLPAKTYNWGAVVTADSGSGFYFADFHGDHVLVFDKPGAAPRRVEASEVLLYDNSLTVPQKVKRPTVAEIKSKAAQPSPPPKGYRRVCQNGRCILVPIDSSPQQEAAQVQQQWLTAQHYSSSSGGLFGGRLRQRARGAMCSIFGGCR
jgi:hypothetical protein